jgi:predicted permease
MLALPLSDTWVDPVESLATLGGGAMRWISVAEFRQAVRSLRRSPAVLTWSVTCLAIGIGATTALSSAISRALLQPLPFREPERLVAVHRITPQSGPEGGWSQSAANYLELARQSTQIRGLAAVTWSSAVINVGDEPIQASSIRVTGNLFETLGARAQEGRLITPADDGPGAPAVAVLSDELWRSRFVADASVVGRTLLINGTPTTIVGIAPPEFRVPLGRNLLRSGLWVPMRFSAEDLLRSRGNYLLTLGRLARGATPQSAQVELRAIFANLVRDHPELRGDNVRVAALQAENVKPLRRPLILLFGAVCMVLLIAATNVAAMLLARGVHRRREFAVRTALGATPTDTIRLSILESLILSAISVVIGIGLAGAGVKTIGLLAAARMPQLEGLRLDPLVLGSAIVLSLVVAVTCSAMPAWHSSRVDPQDALRAGRGGGTGRDHHRALRALVILEISLSLVLLIGAGLVFKAFSSLLGLDPGFDASRVMTLRVNVSPPRYPESDTKRHFLLPALAAIERTPGIEAVSDISAVPYAAWGNNSGIWYEGRPRGEPAQWPIVEQRQVSPAFFAVTKQRLLSGRLLTTSDGGSGPYVVVVNEALVKRDFDGRDPIGRRFHISDTTFGTIVGVVSDIKNAGPFGPPAPEMYSSSQQSYRSASSYAFMIRVRAGDPVSVTSGVRSAIRSVDPSAAVAGVASMNDVIGRSLGAPQFYFSMLGTFAAIAIVLAIAGLYGVLSYAVAQRSREIGIRSALGSTRPAIIGLIAKEGFRLIAFGVLIGLAGGAAVTRLMIFMLYGASPHDRSVWLVATLVVIGAGMLAALIPARRASRVDPLVAMQAE